MLLNKHTPQIRSRTGVQSKPSRAVRPVCCQAYTKAHRGAVRSLFERVLDVAAAVLVSASAASGIPSSAAAEELQTNAAGKQVPEAVYFGNGCFWGRQFDFVNTEKQVLGRAPEQVSAVVGYAGGREAGPDGKVCYYLGQPQSVYERLGHAEVVKVELTPEEARAREEFRVFADTYFKQFKRSPTGQMMRLDPQDAGPGYRNVIGLPGGTRSPLFSVLQEANVNGMELREGAGNQWSKDPFGRERPTEDDLLNTVWVLDSNQLPFYQAEKYHQFHTGIGKLFPLSYLLDQKSVAERTGKITSTGCPELPF